MHDLLGLAFASANVLLSFLGFVLVLVGIRRFKTGLIVKTLKRSIPAGVFLFLFFATEALVAIDVLPSNTPIDDILGTLFMVGLLYVTYGFVNDWTHLDSTLPSN
jgi:branched-subunit amino acid transport protein AzlD